MNIHRINANLFDVQSERDPERTYVVNLAGEGSCSCPSHQFRGGECKHMAAVRNQPEPTALAKAAAKAETLTDEQLRMWAAQHNGEVAGAACLLELAARKLKQQPKPIPAGVLALLEGATEAERERALACYK
jgi:uncharacterized Zn finger protein